MKSNKILNFLSAISLICFGAFSCSSQDDNIFQDKNKTAEEAGYESFEEIPIDELTCYTGGKGQSECKVEPGVKIGDFVTMGCSVTCGEGYYACCGLRCVCRPESSK